MQNFKNLFHLLEAIIANIIYGFPSKKLRVIGVTGTDGKTTVTHLIYRILKTAGKKASLISSIEAVVAGRRYDTGFHTTTPKALAIQRYLAQAAANGDEFFVLETTSHALDQYRVWGITYEMAVLTNITREHLDYHKTYEEYCNSKLKLLQNAKIACVNADDDSYKRIKSLPRFNRGQKSLKSKIITYAIKNKADITWNDDLKNSLLGDFNKQNILAAYAVGQALKIDQSLIAEAITNFRLPHGRLDLVYDKDFKVIIDFAHTPNALKEVLSTIRRHLMSKKGRLIHIFGSAGLRDETKRPFMGEASGQYADIVILTEEDYRVESLNLICQQIAQGLKKHSFTMVPERLEAIKLGIALAQKGDVVVLTGKGHEKSLCRGKKEYPWDEYQAVKQGLGVKFKAQKSK